MNFEKLFSEMLKGTRFERNYENLKENAEKTDAFATQLEQGFDGLMGLLESASEYVTEVVGNLRTAADQMREQAHQAQSLYDSVKPQSKKTSAATREEKLAHIAATMRSAGITTGNKWLDPLYTGIAPDKIIDYTYKLFGGK